MKILLAAIAIQYIIGYIMFIHIMWAEQGDIKVKLSPKEYVAWFFFYLLFYVLVQILPDFYNWFTGKG